MPIVRLQMGQKLNPDDIKEGDGVYFECNIKSNPKPYKLTWYHDVSTLFVLKNLNAYVCFFLSEVFFYMFTDVFDLS